MPIPATDQSICPQYLQQSTVRARTGIDIFQVLGVAVEIICDTDIDTKSWNRKTSLLRDRSNGTRGQARASIVRLALPPPAISYDRATAG
jgi:hypothetical protein